MTQIINFILFTALFTNNLTAEQQTIGLNNTLNNSQSQQKILSTIPKFSQIQSQLISQADTESQISSIQKNIQLPTNKSLHKKNNEAIYSGLRMISEVINLIESKAIRNVDFKKFIEEALKAAIPLCDAHSAFFSKKSYKETIDSTSGKFSGVGVSIISKLPEDDGLTIVDVIDGGPAQKAGCLAGDEIIEVDGEKLKGLTSDEIVSKLKGPIGTKVKIKVIRNKKLHEFTITRDIIKNEVATSFYFPNQNIYYISLRLFTENAAKNLAEILNKVQEEKTKGILIDLRRNPGGVLESAVDMAGLFLKNNSLVVYTKNREGKTVSSHKTTTQPIFKGQIPIFFLIDNFTASASEILAGCLRYYSDLDETNNLKVFIVGTQTFGKGSVQEVIPISNGCAIKLTTMLYYLPNNESIQANGVKPDFLIKPKICPDEDIKMVKELYGTESSIKHHITRKEVDLLEGKITTTIDNESNNKKEEEATDQKESKESWDVKQKKALKQDPIVQGAINLINLLSFAQNSKPEVVSSRSKALEFLKKNFVCDDEIAIEKMKN